MSPARQLETFLFPYFVDVPLVLKDVFVVLVVSGILASVVWRMRRLAFRQAEVERQRTNLARYFSPNSSTSLPATRTCSTRTRCRRPP